GIRIKLRFQAETSASFIGGSAFSDFCISQPVSRVKLHSRKIRVYIHSHTPGRTGHTGDLTHAFTLTVQHHIVVIAAGAFELLVLNIDFQADSFGNGKVKGRPLYRTKLTGWNGVRIRGRKEIRVYPEHMILYGSLPVMSCQIKIAVVCQIHDGVL